MARSYGQIMSAIWQDPDFRKLSGGAQRAYLMLVTQADISSAGTLSLTVGRWSRYAADTSSDALWHALSELDDSAFISFDRDTEELLVRKFVKWDGGAHNAKRRPAITAAANAVASSPIRETLARELDALGVPHSLFRPSDTPPDTPRVVVTEGEYYLNPEPDPQPTTHNPGTVAHAAPDAPTAQTIVGEWMDYVAKRPPGAVIGHTSKHIADMLAEDIDPDDIRRGVRAWSDKGLHPSVLPSVVNEVMNGRAREAPRKRNADDRVRDGLFIAQQLAEQEAQTSPRQIGA